MPPSARRTAHSVFIELVQRRAGDPRALRPVLTAARLLGLAGGVRLTRLARIPPKHRPHYSPAERFRILELKHLHGLTMEETAWRFLVTPTTVARADR
jgi:hypothetical protein